LTDETSVLDASLEKLGISGTKHKISRAVNVAPLQTDSSSLVQTRSTVRLRQVLETEAGTKIPSNPNEADDEGIEAEDEGTREVDNFEANFKASRLEYEADDEDVTREVYDSKEEDNVQATRKDAKEEDTVKATKLDDTEVKVQNWNLKLARKLGKTLTSKMESSMDVLRALFLQRHKRRMTQSFLGWLHRQANYKPCGIGMTLVVGLAKVVTHRRPEPSLSTSGRSSEGLSMWTGGRFGPRACVRTFWQVGTL
jgi:hypothetical protein